MNVASRRARAAQSVLLVAALVGCGDGGSAGPASGDAPGDAGPRRSILLISMDTTRSDHLHCYGYPLAITPNIDALAARGVRYAEAYAPMPQTLPSHVSLLTGLWPRQHMTLENVYSVHEEVETAAEQLGARGYATGAFIGALALHSLSRVDQGFDVWDQPDGRWIEDIMHPSQRPAAEVVDAALGWADGLRRDEPFFMFAHFYDPHGPFEAPQKFVRDIPLEDVLRFVRERRAAGEFGDLKADVTDTALAQFWQGYAAEIHYTDVQIGRLLDGLRERGLLDDTVVALVGDHGEGLYEHGVKGHGLEIWEELHRVPLLLALPDGRFAGRVVEGRVTLVDVLPTLLNAALGVRGIVDDADRGRDLLRLLDDGRDVPAIPIWLERPHFSRERMRGGGQWGEQIAVVDGTLKLLRYPDGRVSLYDLAADPAERHDVAAARPADRARLEALLNGWRKAHPTPEPGEQSGELDPERAEALRQLGYLGGPDEHERAAAARDDEPSGDG